MKGSLSGAGFIMEASIITNIIPQGSLYLWKKYTKPYTSLLKSQYSGFAIPRTKRMVGLSSLAARLIHRATILTPGLGFRV